MRRLIGALLVGTLLVTQTGCVFDFDLDEGDGGVLYVDRPCWDCAGGYYDEFVYTPDHYRDIWIEEVVVDEVWFTDYPAGEWTDEWYYDDGYFDDEWYDPYDPWDWGGGYFDEGWFED